MTKVITMAVSLIVVVSSVCVGGTNPNAKVAVHVMPHASRSCTKNFPAIDGCEDIVYTYSGGGDIDFFVVFYDLTAYQGFQYTVTWPTEWGICTFTSCSDLTIGGIEAPGDSVAHAYTLCDSSNVCIPGFGWLDAGEAPGYVQVVEAPRTYEIEVGGCEGEPDSVILNSKAGVNGYTGDDPCDTGGRDSGGGEGESPDLRIAQVIEVTDGSTTYMQPIWSPDGRKLAFTKPGFTGIYVRNADGSGPIQEITSADYSGYKPVWTSDSNGIVLRTRTGIVRQSITSIEVETGEVKTLVEGAAHPGQPERNAFGDVTVDVDGEMKVLDRVTGTLESMDGYYSQERPPSIDVRLEMDHRNRRMWIADGDGSSRTEFPHRVLLARLSPTRVRVAFGQADGNLYVSRLDGSSVVNLGLGCRWDWSPDGELVVYLSAIEQNEWTVTATDLFIGSADGSGVAQLSDTPDIVEDYPVWSPDGRSIAYSGVNTGKIYVAVLEEVR
jgi:hypothetical protein